MAEDRFDTANDDDLGDEALDRSGAGKFFCGGSLSAFCTGS